MKFHWMKITAEQTNLSRRKNTVLMCDILLKIQTCSGNMTSSSAGAADNIIGKNSYTTVLLTLVIN